MGEVVAFFKGGGFREGKTDNRSACVPAVVVVLVGVRHMTARRPTLSHVGAQHDSP